MLRSSFLNSFKNIELLICRISLVLLPLFWRKSAAKFSCVFIKFKDILLLNIQFFNLYFLCNLLWDFEKVLEMYWVYICTPRKATSIESDWNGGSEKETQTSLETRPRRVLTTDWAENHSGCPANPRAKAIDLTKSSWVSHLAPGALPTTEAQNIHLRTLLCKVRAGAKSNATALHVTLHLHSSDSGFSPAKKRPFEVLQRRELLDSLWEVKKVLEWRGEKHPKELISKILVRIILLYR